ncbi:MAG TPA: N-acetyltransferase [Hyphomonadaceae bacterium]|nr:N-acetyltransferase [Hyphomonadaceae bacterium]
MSERTFRVMTQADKPAVLDLSTRAFGQPDEARIIEQLEKDNDVVLQIVAESDGQIVGHILFYRVGVYGRLGAVGLGPMSVDPWVQKEGIGKSLVLHGLKMLNDVSVPIVFVLGHDWFYPKFGFSVAQAAEFQTSLKGDHFMALRLRHGPPMSGRLIFPDAFGVPIAEV